MLLEIVYLYYAKDTVIKLIFLQYSGDGSSRCTQAQKNCD